MLVTSEAVSDVTETSGRLSSPSTRGGGTVSAPVSASALRHAAVALLLTLRSETLLLLLLPSATRGVDGRGLGSVTLKSVGSTLSNVAGRSLGCHRLTILRIVGRGCVGRVLGRLRLLRRVTIELAGGRTVLTPLNS